jgi:hypothetical protein
MGKELKNMAKRPRGGKKQSDDRLKKKWGDVNASVYKPFLLIHDFSSLGRVSRIKYKGREIHTMSDLETTVLSELLWSDRVVDIRDQVALSKKEPKPGPVGKKEDPDRLATERIAEQMGVRHPIMQDGNLAIMTTDLVARLKSGTRLRAFSIKPLAAVARRAGAADRSVRRTIEKLEIERRYWRELDADWFLVTDADVCPIRKMNIGLLLSTPSPDHPNHEAYWVDRLAQTLEAVLSQTLMPLEAIARTLAGEWMVSPARIIENIRLLCAHRFLEFDMSVPFSQTMAANSFRVGPVFRGLGAASSDRAAA